MAAEIPDPEEWTPPEEERGRVGECHGCFFWGGHRVPKLRTDVLGSISRSPARFLDTFWRLVWEKHGNLQQH